MTDIEDYLSQVCSKVGNGLWYIGYSIADYSCSRYESMDPSYAKESMSLIQDFAAKEYSNTLSCSAAIVSPCNIATALYKVRSKDFKAYPIVNGNGLSRFFNSCYCDIKATGIVIVSHKLKMLSFVWACYDEEQNHIALWFSGADVGNWLAYDKSSFMSNDEDDTVYQGHWRGNRMHVAYKPIFGLHDRASTVCTPYELCIDIEDHYRNDLLARKLYARRRISTFNSSIKSAEHTIESAKSEIEEYRQEIADEEAAVVRYGDDLYASRVESELRK